MSPLYARISFSSVCQVAKEFIEEVHRNEDDFSIVSAIIQMAHSLGKKVVAEGVESPEQMTILKQLQCDMVQGFLFAKPMPLEALGVYHRSKQ